MPTTENDRRNRQQPVLENPSMPDHDRTKDEGMHRARPEQPEFPIDAEDVDEATAPPDQEFSEVLQSGFASNQGRIPDDPNNWLTSEPGKSLVDQDPEDRGESLPDILERDKH